MLQLLAKYQWERCTCGDLRCFWWRTIAGQRMVSIFVLPSLFFPEGE